MSKKKKLTIWDLGRIKSSPPVENKSGYQTRKEFLEQEERERIAAENSAERRRTAPLREAEQELREAAREASARIAMYWKIPIEEIQMNPVSITRVDIAGDYEIGPRDEPAENAAWKEFQENLKSFGCTLSDAGLLRLSHYLSSLNYHRGISLTSVSNFATALGRLVSLGVFQSGELSGYRPPATQTTPEPARHAVLDPDRRATMDDLLALGDSRQDQRDARRIADELYFDERQPMVRAWFDSLRKFGIVITHTDADYCKKWFQRNNKSFLVPAHFNECRRHMVASHRWPISCLTNLEAFELSLETIETSQLTVSQRNDLRRREQAAREADAQRFGK